MSNALELQDYSRPPETVAGRPTTIRMGEVSGLNGDNTIDVRPLLGRASKVLVPYPSWYSPAIGDKVLYCDLNGNPRTPVVISPFTGQITDGGN